MLSTMNQITTFRLHAIVKTAIEHDYRNEWMVVVTRYSR